eukprot:scaffold17718_cov109-Isochrysis_galbana.AAC.5
MSRDESPSPRTHRPCAICCNAESPCRQLPFTICSNIELLPASRFHVHTLLGTIIAEHVDRARPESLGGAAAVRELDGGAPWRRLATASAASAFLRRDVDPG